MDKSRLEETAAFLREHRSNEGHFETIFSRLQQDAAASNGEYANTLNEIAEKSGDAYRKAKETGGTAWPEFETFVSDYEKAVTEVLRS